MHLYNVLLIDKDFQRNPVNSWCFFFLKAFGEKPPISPSTNQPLPLRHSAGTDRRVENPQSNHRVEDNASGGPMRKPGSLMSITHRIHGCLVYWATFGCFLLMVNVDKYIIDGFYGTYKWHQPKQCTKGKSITNQGSIYYQPKLCIVTREIPQKYPKFVLFDPPKIGNLMTLANCICNFVDPSNMRVVVSTKGPDHFLFHRGCST